MSVADMIQGTMRTAGGAVNALLTAAFGWGAVRLAGLASAEFEAAGGTQHFALSSIQAVGDVRTEAGNAMHYAAAWTAAVFAAGAAYMALLGVRWCYHAAIRLAGTVRRQT